MKKILLIVSAFLLLLAATNCARPTEWNEVQRAEFIAALDDYRQMIYLNELSDPEFVTFTSDLSSDVEFSYPVYTEFIVIPALSDSVDMWVVSSIVDELNADASNIRHLYPYYSLVAQEILPAGLDIATQKEFYNCFAQKVNTNFSSLNSFFSAVLTNSLEPNIISDLQTECAQMFVVE